MKKKKTVTPERRQRQRKLSSYLVRTREVREVDDISERNIANETCRKRRLTEHTEEHFQQFKAAKSNDSDDVYIVDCVQRHIDVSQLESTSAPMIVMYDDTDTISSDCTNATTSVKKSTRIEHDRKENIDVNISKNLSNLRKTHTQVQNSNSANSSIILSDQSSIDECTASLKEKSKHFDNNLSIEIVGEVIESDTQLLDHNVNDTDKINSDCTNAVRSVKKGTITEYGGKENIDVNISKNLLSSLRKTQTQVQNSSSANSSIILSDQSSIDECTASLKEKSKYFDNNLSIEIVGEVIESDTQLLDHNVNDTDKINSDCTNATTSVKKGTITEYGGKENIDVNISKNLLSNLKKTQTQVQNSSSANSSIILSDQSSIDECTASLKEKSKYFDNKLSIEIVGEVVESDTQLLDHNVNDSDLINSDCTNTPTSVKKSIITECDGKENIDVNVSKNLLSNLKEIQTQVQNSDSANSSIISSDQSSIDERTPSLKEKSKSSDNSLSVEVVGEVVKSDTQLDQDVTDISGILNEDWFFEDDANFNSLRRCELIDLKYEKDALLLTVRTSQFDAPVVIRCLEFWKETKVQKNSIIAVEARRDQDCWVVDNKTGFVVTYPDRLVSSTTITDSIFCQRKSILKEKFKKMESLPYFQADQTALLVGNLAHELLQKALKANITKFGDVKNLLNDMLHSTEVALKLYDANVTFEMCRKQMLPFVPKIYSFIRHYCKGKPQADITSIKDNFKGSIVDVTDIEEMIWLPKLGIKGKIDVTVKVKTDSIVKKMPLEIKTGKSSYSSEHKGQVILYIMMMALTGNNADTGLLLYLRENSMQEIKSNHPDRRNLILLRNTLAYYLTPKSLDTSSKSSVWNWPGFQLPEPINHAPACASCLYNTLCCAYLSKDSTIKLSESHPLNELKKRILENVLTDSHRDYVLKWILMLEIEDQARTTDNPESNLWMLSADERELRRTCIANLKISLTVKGHNGRYKYTVVRNNSKDQKKKIPYMEFSSNDYVLISTDKRVNISPAFIVSSNASSVVIVTDRDITKYIDQESFHIDKFPFSTSHYTNLANVGGLLGNSAICAKLRSIVIDRKPATFEPGVSESLTLKASEILKDLNKVQRRAVLKVLTANDYILIKGMPGTGKTQTLVTLIELLYKTGHSVLVTSHTNSAVDNILLKLLRRGINFLRLGSSTHESLKNYTDRRVIATCETPEEIDITFSEPIVGVTCCGANNSVLSKRVFDFCVVDESAQVFQASILRPLYNARKFVLVGDPDQISPIVKSVEARRLGADESLFSRLDSQNNTVILNTQYRMNKCIMKLANKLAYHDQLNAGNVHVENATYSAICEKINILDQSPVWIKKALSPNIDDSVVLINTGRTIGIKITENLTIKYPQSDQRYSNVFEGAIILQLLQTLLQMHVKAENIGIIAPYKSQVHLLQTIIKNNIEVNTVDQFQGRDKEIIIYSCAKSLINTNIVSREFEVLGDHRRLTVAITRAKHKLIIVGDQQALREHSPLKKLFNLIGEEHTINLNDRRYNFSWDQVTSIL